MFNEFVQTYKNIELYCPFHTYSLQARDGGMGVRVRRRERDRVAIVAEILEMAREGVLKSNIMWRAGLSYRMLNGYLRLMMSTRLLGKSCLNKKEVFRTTDRGLKFLHHCNEIMELLQTEDDEQKLYGRIRFVPSCVSIVSETGREARIGIG
jgi:predicted transcriptional regulator